MFTLKKTQKFVEKILKSALDMNKPSVTLEKLFLKILTSTDLPKNLRSTLLVMFAIGILVEILFVTLILGLGFLLLIYK